MVSLTTTGPATTFVTGRKSWTGHSRGGAFMLGACASLIPLVGWRGVWLLSIPLAVPYLLFDHHLRRVLVRFWRRVEPEASHGRLLARTFAHIIHWGRSHCDRMLFYQDRFAFSIRGMDILRQYVRHGHGAILLSAHVGNWEVSTARANWFTRGRVHMVRVDEERPLARWIIERFQGERFPTTIDPRDPVGASVAISRALAEGDVVCMLGDRQLGHQLAVRVPFLGGMATFSAGPILAAAIAGVPLVVCFMRKVGHTRYLLEVDEPWWISLPRKRTDRRQALAEWVARWAQRLEAQVRKDPRQWHNNFDIWG